MASCCIIFRTMISALALLNTLDDGLNSPWPHDLDEHQEITRSILACPYTNWQSSLHSDNTYSSGLFVNPPLF
ncbi:hypothetical protein FPV67DRAFT_1511228 [Lyophyllum atratum]|nr:hypothetical protein FPV67DRAFT_1511228 [Lyophyllum atratum]